MGRTGCRISIHAPARGATGKKHPSDRSTEHFNSRPCERGDVLEPAKGTWRVYISIHAPARGATRIGTLCAPSHKISIHAPARGATTQRSISTRSCGFQFTPLREGRRHAEQESLSDPLYFNSRPCERGDANGGVKIPGYTQFQFTPLREGRQVIGRIFDGMKKISIHAPARGATSEPSSSAASTTFQFTPLREGRRQNSTNNNSCFASILLKI